MAHIYIPLYSDAVFTENGGKSVRVIHCYGHGGSGITLAYGCAIDVANLVESAMKLKSKL